MTSGKYNTLGSSNVFKTAAASRPGHIPFRALQVGERIAVRAMQIMMEQRPKPGAAGIEDKSVNDWLTKADKDVQEMAIKTVLEEFPSHRFIAEEAFDSALQATPDSDDVWSIDPIDGTSFFAYKDTNILGTAAAIIPGYVQFGIQMCYLREGYPKFSIFAAPVMDVDGSGYSIFEAVNGIQGAFLNGSPVSFSANGPLAGSLGMLALAFTDYESELRGHLVKALGLKTCMPRGGCAGAEFSLLIKRPAILENYNIIGTVRLKPWDLLPGAYLVIKSGGAMRFIDNGQIFPFNVGMPGDDFRSKPAFACSAANMEWVFNALSGFGRKF